jgi:cardiolipin synthase
MRLWDRVAFRLGLAVVLPLAVIAGLRLLADSGGYGALWAAGPAQTLSQLRATVSAIRLYAVHPWALYSSDEALALINTGNVTQLLGGWGVSDGDPEPDLSLPEINLAPGGILWIADDAAAFRAAFGFWPDVALHGAGTEACPHKATGTWPGFANQGDEVILYADGEGVVDVLVYGGGTAPAEGWRGAPVPYPMSGFGNAGQLLYRKLDETTGAPWPDTDSSVDWAADRSCGQLLYGPVCEGDLFGKRVVYPGWDWGLVTDTLEVRASSLLTVGIAPDNAYTVVANLLSDADDEILIEAYSLESVWLTQILTQRIAAGVAVTVLLEGGAISEQGLWNGDQIARAGGEVYYMHNDPGAGVYGRYRNQHAKYAIVDHKWLAVSTENFGNRGMPVDDKTNGTAGSRGVVLVSDEPAAVAYMVALFGRDCDREHHADVVSYGGLPRYTVPITYTPVYSTGGGGYTYMAPFSPTVPAFTVGQLELLHAPETSLRYDDGLIGLLLRAGPGDEVCVEQMYERLHWGPATSEPAIDPNPRLEAYIEAARRGAAVRVLLDNGLDRERLNYETAFYLLQASDAEGLDLEVRLGNPTLWGLHNKMVLVRVASTKAEYAHVGSINGSEVSSKVNRELALQVRSPAVYDYLKQVWDYDWAHSRAPHEQYLPLVKERYVAEARHVVISEFLFKEAGSGEELGEWIELYNPTDTQIEIGGWSLGDAVHANDYERSYAFPGGTLLGPRGTLVVARQAVAYQSVGYATRPVADLEWSNSNGVPDMIRTAWGDGECALGNAGDEILLRDASGRIVDAVVYGEGWLDGVASFANVDSVYNGNSLERWPANRDSDDCSHDFRVRYAPDPGGVVAW